MAVQLDHTIVVAHDKHASAAFLAHILGLEVGPPMGPFVPVVTANGVTLDFYTHDGPLETIAHYAFLVSEDEFSASLARIEEADVTYYSGPRLDRPGEINRNDGGRGLYFLDPAGNTMEILTVPYGGWPDEARGPS